MNGSRIGCRKCIQSSGIPYEGPVCIVQYTLYCIVRELYIIGAAKYQRHRADDKPQRAADNRRHRAADKCRRAKDQRRHAKKELRFAARRRYEQGELRQAEEECRLRGEARAVS